MARRAPDSRAVTTSASEWTAWRPLRPAWAPSPEVLAETLDGGQAFRWFRRSPEPAARRSLGTAEQSTGVSPGAARPPAPDIWTGAWSDCFVQVRTARDGLEWRAPLTLAPRVAEALPRYLGADRDWAALADALPWRSDPHLARCLETFPGLRILRQPFGETLLGFLCSATKQIVQIKQMVALLAARHGTRVPPSTSNDLPSTASFTLPTWPALAALSERELRACQLGFRARFIHQTARFLEENPGWLEKTESMPYSQAKARLMELPGVGEKVADCVLLFGAGQLEAFPVDTWILKSLERRYGLLGWRPSQVAHFGRAHFGPLAGLAQQYLFAWERRFAR